MYILAIYYFVPYCKDLFSLSLSLDRLRIYSEDGMFLDTNCVCDNMVKGGKLGLYVFEQASVFFSNLQYGCLKPSDEQSLMQCQA